MTKLKIILVAMFIPLLVMGGSTVLKKIDEISPSVTGGDITINTPTGDFDVNADYLLAPKGGFNDATIRDRNAPTTDTGIGIDAVSGFVYTLINGGQGLAVGVSQVQFFKKSQFLANPQSTTALGIQIGTVGTKNTGLYAGNSDSDLLLVADGVDGIKIESTQNTMLVDTIFNTQTATTVPYLDATKKLISSAVTPTELGYVSGVTSAIQTQLDAKSDVDLSNVAEDILPDTDQTRDLGASGSRWGEGWFVELNLDYNIFKHRITPSNPAAGFIKLYTKGDDRFYSLTSAGVETDISASTLTVTSKTAAYTVTTSDDLVLSDSSGGAFTLDLFSAASSSGKVVRITKTDSSTNAVTIDAFSTQTMDGFLTYALCCQYDTIELISDGANWSVLKYPRIKVAYVKGVQASGVNGNAGATFTSGAYRTRVLNTVEGDSSIVSLASNQFTLDAGDYKIEATAPAFWVNAHKAKLYDITNTADVKIGSTETSGAAANVATISKVIAELTITSTTTYEIQHRAQTTKASNGFGAATSFGDSEIYTQVTITKLR